LKLPKDRTLIDRSQAASFHLIKSKIQSGSFTHTGLQRRCLIKTQPSRPCPPRIRRSRWLSLHQRRRLLEQVGWRSGVVRNTLHEVVFCLRPGLPRSSQKPDDGYFHEYPHRRRDAYDSTLPREVPEIPTTPPMGLVEDVFEEMVPGPELSCVPKFADNVGLVVNLIYILRTGLKLRVCKRC
jgi:hypothetical protein